MQAKKIDKPWGYELVWAETPHYVGKILVINPGESLSLQYHKIKEETLYLESGECLLEAGEDESQLKKINLVAGDVFHIPPGYRHRLSAVTKCRFFEVSTPHLTDVVRLQDKYGRH